MSKKAVNVGIIVLSAALMIGSTVGLYNTELNRGENVSENQSYIMCDETALSLAKSAGIADEKPVSHAADTTGMSKMEADLKWLADYDTELSQLDRQYNELSTSPAVDGTASYADACSAAVSYHQAQLDDANSSASAMTAVCIAVFVIGLVGMSIAVVAKSKD